MKALLVNPPKSFPSLVAVQVPGGRYSSAIVEAACASALRHRYHVPVVCGEMFHIEGPK